MFKKSIIRFITILIMYFNFFSVHHCYSLGEVNKDRLEKYWWGYRRYISNEQVSKFASEFDSIAAELSLFGGLCVPVSFVNPVAGVLASGVLEIYSSYYWFISTNIVKLNRGKGVIVDFTKGIIFNIKPI